MTYSTIKHIQEFVIILYNYSEFLANTIKFTTLIVLLCVVVHVVGDHLNDQPDIVPRRLYLYDDEIIYVHSRLNSEFTPAFSELEVITIFVFIYVI